MDKSRFDEMIKTLIKKCKSRESPGNAVAVASRLLEITNATSDIERELDECKTAIMKNLQRHESLIMVTGRLRASCEKFAAFDGELRDFEANARSRIGEIEEIRDVFLQGLREDDDNRENDAGRAQRLREIIREITQLRDNLLTEINSADQGIAFLTAQLEEMDVRIRREKMENDAFCACMEVTQNVNKTEQN